MLHFLYGTGAGWVLGLIAAGGLLLFTLPALVWFRVVIGMDADPQQMLMPTGVHVVYGLVLGAWLGLGILV